MLWLNGSVFEGAFLCFKGSAFQVAFFQQGSVLEGGLFWWLKRICFGGCRNLFGGCKGLFLRVPFFWWVSPFSVVKKGSVLEGALFGG